jgi:hypothetical protein
MLREFYPAALVAFDDLAGRDALAVLATAPTPAAGQALTAEAIIDLLRQAGRRRYLTPCDVLAGLIQRSCAVTAVS